MISVVPPLGMGNKRALGRYTCYVATWITRDDSILNPGLHSRTLVFRAHRLREPVVTHLTIHLLE
jgi:hypothetical protein